MANLAGLVLAPAANPEARLAVATEKKKPGRYDRGDYPQSLLSKTLRAMEDVGAIHRHPYVFKQRLTTIEPTAEFRAKLQADGVRLSDIGRNIGAETIWLTARSGFRPRHGLPMPKLLMPYQDTEESRRYRAQVESINAHLNRAAITFAGERQAPVALRRVFTLRSPQDPVRFDLGGRLFGGFWMNLPSRERYKLAMGGEPVADLDYAAMFARLAYLKAGQVPPNTDPYAISGLEEHRDGAKMALLSLLSRSTDLKQLAPELRAALPEGWNAKRLREAAAAYHPRIAHLFGTDVGIELMFAESQLLVRVMLELAAEDIAGLPMHDGVMVPNSQADRAAHIMEQAAVRTFGVTIPVKEKAIWRP